MEKISEEERKNGVIAASLNDEVVAAAAASGCIGLNIGIESGNASILRAIKKPGTPRIFLRAAEILRKYPQINTRALLIIGFPNEKMEHIQETIDFSKSLGSDWNCFQIATPLVGSEMFDQFSEMGVLDFKSRNWENKIHALMQAS